MGREDISMKCEADKTSKSMRWTGRVLSGVIILFMLFMKDLTLS